MVEMSLAYANHSIKIDNWVYHRVLKSDSNNMMIVKR